jgi:hypothetical protein
MDQPQKKSLFRKLLLLYAVTFLLSNGPGLLLVNKPVLVAGMPILYVWALFWGVVQIGIILYAYRRLWKNEADTSDQPPDSLPGRTP